MPKVHVMVATRGVSFKRGRCYQNECNWHFVYAQSCESREMSWKIQLLICMCECVRFMPECCCALQKRGMWHSNILTLITHNHVWCSYRPAVLRSFSGTVCNNAPFLWLNSALHLTLNPQNPMHCALSERVSLHLIILVSSDSTLSFLLSHWVCRFLTLELSLTLVECWLLLKWTSYIIVDCRSLQTLQLHHYTNFHHSTLIF